MRTIEEEIKQKKPFKNDYQRAAVNLIYTGKWVVQLHSEIFKEFNLTLQQYNTLRILKGSYPKSVTAKYIRMRMLDKTSDVSRIVETMFKNGLINRTANSTDRRKIDITITENGMDILNQLKNKEGVMDDALSNLNRLEINLLNTLLNKLRN